MDPKDRKPLQCNPTASFTMKREEFKQNEDLRLVSHFAHYLSKVGDKPVSEENFESDLLDGVCLCRLMAKLNGSGMTKFHDNINNTNLADAWKSKENLVSFQQATKNLNLPISFGTEDLEKKNTTRVISTLIFLAHVAHSQNVTVQDMDQEILEKVEQIEEELAAKLNETTATVPTADGQLTWWQALLVKFGFGDWINSLSLEALKQYLETVKKNVQQKVEDQKQSLTQKIEEQKQFIQQKVEEQRTMVRQKSMDLREKLPDSIKAKLGAPAAAAPEAAAPVEAN